MTERNVHGEWRLSFENRILLTQVSGSTNSEAVKAWLKEAIDLVDSSHFGLESAWAVLVDASDWGMSPGDSWEAHNIMVVELEENNCQIFAVVFSKKIHEFSLEQGFQDKGMVQLFHNYDEAYQACLDKLSEVEYQIKK
ncbi:hypothetical protein L4C34_17280 [Vibrio profundum]|uniref:hypothetical protein n=1 Tax=Vibrio profundum TaxID=2910247 RepID=UPI003D0B1FBD